MKYTSKVTEKLRNEKQRDIAGTKLFNEFLHNHKKAISK